VFKEFQAEVKQVYALLKEKIRHLYTDLLRQYQAAAPGPRLVIKIAVIAVVCAIIFSFVYSSWNSSKLARTLFLPIPVAGYEVAVGDVSTTIGASGTAQEHSLVSINSLVKAQTEKVLVNIGDLVKRGTPLLEVDQSSYAPALAAAQQQELAAKSTVEKDEALLKATQDMLKQGLAEQVDIQTAESTLATARQLDSQALALVATTQREVDFTRLSSPINGIVITRSVDPGSPLVEDQAVFTLGDLDTVYFQGLVQEDYVSFLDKGAKADVIFSSLPNQTFQGVVEKIDPTTDPTTRTFNAYVAIPNPDLILKPGLTGFTRIKLQRTGLIIPETAVMNQFGETANVFVVNKDSRAVLTPVRLGLLGQNSY
jgi:HlyD family secretion protein